MKEHYSGNIMADLLDADYEEWLEDEEWQAQRAWWAIDHAIDEEVERAIERRHKYD